MKSLLAGLLILCFAQLAIAQEKPNREQTIEYINKILKKNVGMECDLAWQSQNRTFKEAYLEYNTNDRSYTFYYSYNENDRDYAGCETQTTRHYRNFTFKNISNISDGMPLSPSRNSNRVSPVKYVGITFPTKEVTQKERSQYLYSSECRNNKGSTISESNKPNDGIIIPYPTGDPDDLRRLKNAFLRLKELDAELKDPFLD